MHFELLYLLFGWFHFVFLKSFVRLQLPQVVSFRVCADSSLNALRGDLLRSLKQPQAGYPISGLRPHNPFSLCGI